MNYITKINDFKNVFSEIVNPENNNDKSEVIEALFDNVRRNYEEYKDTVPLIHTYYEPYEYHILQPTRDCYTLLDFLLNRAISNLEKININRGDGNSHSNHLEVNIDITRYDKLASNQSQSTINTQYKKSKYHETLHTLHSKFRDEKGCFYSNDDVYFRKKVKLFYDRLSGKYPNILHPSKLNGVRCNGRGTVLTKPFAVEKWSAASKALDEFSTEMEAVLNSGLIKSDVSLCKLGNNCYQILPNFDNAYARYQAFLLQFKALVTKSHYFGSVFFHKSTTVEEFSHLYSNEILSNASKWNINGSALITLCNLFKDALIAIQYKDEIVYDVYETLSNIFIQIFRNKLKNIEQLDNETLEIYKKTFAISYNQCPYIPGNGVAVPNWIGETYKKFYDIVCNELEKRDTKGKRY